jgi:hypothetical protein
LQREFAAAKISAFQKTWECMRDAQGTGELEAAVKDLTRYATYSLDMLVADAVARARSERTGTTRATGETAIAVRRNTEPCLLWTLLDKQHGPLREKSFPLLFFLSRHRMHVDFTTVWEAERTEPKAIVGGEAAEKAAKGDDENILRLLELVQHARVPSPERLPVCAALMLVVRRLAAALLKDRRHLDSPPYRKLLWQSLDAVVWYATMRGLFEELKPDYAHLPVGQRPSPENYLWLIAEFGYVVLGVDRDLRIYEHFRQAAQHEVLLYHSRTEYRDHLFHAVDTFLVGYALLTASGSPVKFILSARGNGRKDRETLREWFLAALCHDFGYVMELVPAALGIAQQFPVNGMRKMVPELKSQWDDKITELNRLVKEQQELRSEIGQKRTDHGVFSYLHLRSELLRLDRLAQEEVSLSGPPSKWKSEHCEQHAEALSAILKHSLAREPVNVRKEPLSALLVLCDELQEWQRPRYNAWELTQSAMVSIHYRELGGAAIRRVSEAVIFENCADDSGRIVFPSGERKIIVRYADQNLNRFDPIIRLLYKVYTLERLEGLKSIPMVLEIQMRRLQRERSPDSETSELDILRDFCLLHEVGVSPELFTRPRAPTVGGRCIRSELADKSPTLDVVRLDLSAFPREPRRESPLIPIPPWDFQEQWFNFKREFCRRKGLLCTLFSDDEEWPEQQITPEVTEPHDGSAGSPASSPPSVRGAESALPPSRRKAESQARRSSGLSVETDGISSRRESGGLGSRGQLPPVGGVAS